MNLKNMPWRSAAALGLALGTTLALSPMAEAATAARPTLTIPAPTAAHHGASSVTFTIPAGQKELVTSGAGAHVKLVKTAAQIPQAITCTLTVDAPALERGEVVATSAVSCTAFVYEIDEEVALFFNGTEVQYYEDAAPNTSGLALSLDYAAPAAGYYQTGGIADVYWTGPSSYSALGPVYSSAVYLA